MAGSIDGNTQVVMTMTQFWGGLAGIATVIVGIGGYALSGVKEDVSSIKKTVETLQTSDKESAIRLREGETRLVEQLSQLRIAIERLDGRMANFDRSAATLYKSVEGLSSRLDETQKLLAQRQASLNDPKSADALIRAFKAAGGTPDDRVFIVPLDGVAPAPK